MSFGGPSINPYQGRTQGKQNPPGSNELRSGYILPHMTTFFQPLMPLPMIRRKGQKILGLLLALLSTPFPPGIEGQALPPGPDSVAAEFQSALRGVGWQAAVSRLHPEALDNFHHLMTLLVEMDTTRAPIERLFPQGGLDAFHAISQEEVFLRVMEVLTEDAPGLVHALVVREVEVVGHVPEGTEMAHVVYRSTANLSGAKPELRLMTMKRDGERWKVLSSQELDILVEAFRGITRRVRPPPGGWPGGAPPDTSFQSQARTR